MSDPALSHSNQSQESVASLATTVVAPSLAPTESSIGSADTITRPRARDTTTFRGEVFEAITDPRDILQKILDSIETYVAKPIRSIDTKAEHIPLWQKCKDADEFTLHIHVEKHHKKLYWQILFSGPPRGVVLPIGWLFHRRERTISRNRATAVIWEVGDLAEWKVEAQHKTVLSRLNGLGQHYTGPWLRGKVDALGHEWEHVWEGIPGEKFSFKLTKQP